MAVLAGERTLPRFPLVATPTPLQRARRLERAVDGPPLYLKRDDLTGFALAGNKARKLELLVADALDRRSDVVLTGGGPASNHCHAAAAAARVAGLDCLLLCYGSRPVEEPPSLAFARGFDVEVWFTGDPRRESVDEGLVTLAEELRAAGRRPYVIPRGGATALGAAAYGLAVAELASQLDRLRVDPATVVVATGSCGTQAGLVAGTVQVGRRWRVVGASVSRPVPECRARVLQLAREAAELCGWPEAAAADVEVRDARDPGYGIRSSAGRAAARLAAHHEGVLLDPVFTEKAMAELFRLVAAGADGPIVFWHTGGVPVPLPPAGDDGEGGGQHARP